MAPDTISPILRFLVLTHDLMNSDDMIRQVEFL